MKMGILPLCAAAVKWGPSVSPPSGMSLGIHTNALILIQITNGENVTFN